MKTQSVRLAMTGLLVLANVAQAQPKTQPMPRRADGRTSLSGVWTNASVTNLA